MRVTTTELMQTSMIKNTKKSVAANNAANGGGKTSCFYREYIIDKRNS